ncbi:hypothetical protein GGS20DRAFT_548769 [Poronia punctata]|nr:hypothetical protein GGS20DRAFT_548769 [Poronia punctata]
MIHLITFCSPRLSGVLLLTSVNQCWLVLPSSSPSNRHALSPHTIDVVRLPALCLATLPAEEGPLWEQDVLLLRQLCSTK